MTESIEHYLSRSLIKDAAKGGNGWRTLAEIANACATERPKMLWASEALAEAHNNGQVEIGLNGPELVYRSTMSVQEARDRHPFYVP